MSYYLAFDLGAESGRAIRGTLRDGKLTLEDVHRFPNQPVAVQGTLHWDVLALLREIRGGIRKAAMEAGEQPAGVGIDTWGVDFGLLDEHGTLLVNPVHYRDRRTEGMIELACGIVPREKIYEITGIAFHPFNTLYQLMAIQRAKPRWFAAASTLLQMPDLLSFFLCGAKTSEYTIASTSQLLDARTRQWSDELCHALGLRRELLPPVVQPGSVKGALSEESQRECNVGPVPVIAPASHDTGSAFAAVPASDPEWITLSCGTWSILGVELDSPRTDPKPLAYNFANEGALEGKVRLLKNIMGLWVLQECRRIWVRAGENVDYAALVQEASCAPAFAAIFDIDDPSFYAPPNMLEALASFCKRTGQKMPQERATLVRAILEGIALRYRAVLGELEEIIGRKVSTVHMVGGGTQNKLLCQMAADAMGRSAVAGPVEATAIGNIVMQAVGTGELRSVSEARSLIRRSVSLEHFEPQNEEQWEETLRRYRRVCETARKE